MKDRQSDSQLFDYEFHDGNKFSVHRVVDPDLQVNFSQSYMKLNFKNSHQEWVDVIKNDPYTLQSKSNYGNQYISLVFVLTLEQANPEVDIANTLVVDQRGSMTQIKVQSKSGNR